MIGELTNDSVIEVEYDGDLYAICRTKGEFRAMYGVCPHQGGPLGQGNVADGLVICPWHMWEFDSSTGACLVDDALGVPTYDVKVEGSGIFVDVPGRA